MNYAGQLAGEVSRVVGSSVKLKRVNTFNGEIMFPQAVLEAILGDPEQHRRRGEVGGDGHGCCYRIQIPEEECASSPVVLRLRKRSCPWIAAAGLRRAGIQNNEVVVVTGIGCWGKADNYLSHQRAARDSRPGLSLCHGSQGGQPRSSCRGFDGRWRRRDDRRKPPDPFRAAQHGFDRRARQQL